MSGLRRQAARLREEEGSTLPLILGYAVLVIAVILVSVCATDLHIAHKRLDALADAAALAGADGFTVVTTSTGVRTELGDDEVLAQARAMIGALDPAAVLVSARTPDGQSAEVTVAAVWHPPVLSPFVPQGVRLESTARSRTALW